EHTVHTRGVEGSSPPLATFGSPENLVFTRFLGFYFLCWDQIESEHQSSHERPSIIHNQKKEDPMENQVQKH
ncbi:MAG: hypothetical protein Q4D16_20515, partial [Eubacteriales bacterium]|nr:hypothetical protein [Eubacteriales bacterium]